MLTVAQRPKAWFGRVVQLGASGHTCLATGSCGFSLYARQMNFAAAGKTADNR